jgi:hypothetical protein
LHDRTLLAAPLSMVESTIGAHRGRYRSGERSIPSVFGAAKSDRFTRLTPHCKGAQAVGPPGWLFQIDVSKYASPPATLINRVSESYYRSYVTETLGVDDFISDEVLTTITDSR